ncbi:MAG TPA: (2Fe-2S)-binding protein [Steroidobacteraceae bacterium]
MKLNVNGMSVDIDAPSDTPLLWILREELGLTSVKFGCGTGVCGACTVHLNGRAVRSCVIPVGSVSDAAVTTLEGLARSAGLAPDELHPVQQAWIDRQVPQCGYCQPGMIMTVAALLQSGTPLTDEQINSAVTNLCRCGTYPRVRKAIRSLAGS